MKDFNLKKYLSNNPLLKEGKQPLNEFMNSLPVPFDKTDGEPFDGVFLSNDSGKSGIFITNDPEFDYGNYESVGDYYEIAGFKVLEVF